MRVRKVVGVTLASIAMAAMAATPTMADPRHGRDRGEHRDRHDKDDDGGVGGFVLGALLAGGLVAALAGKKKEPRPLPADVAFVPVAVSEPAGPPSAADEEAAVAACAASAEGEGRRAFPVAQVGRIGAVEPAGPGFVIRGDLLLRASLRDVGERRAFRCSVDGDAVNGVTIDGLAPRKLAAG